VVELLWYVETVIRILPVYIANATPPVFSKFNVLGLRRPVDGGKLWIDGRRILGDGKTWQGLILGTLVGGLIGFLLEHFGYGSFSLGLLMGFSALAGDMVGSFIKRRLGMKRGANAGLLDSLDFLTAGILISYPFVRWKSGEILLLLIATPIVHRIANIIGFKLKLKKEPW